MSDMVMGLNTWWCNLCQTSGMNSLSRHLETVHPRPENFDYRAAWESCVNDLHRERQYVKQLEADLVAAREMLYDIYYGLPSRRTKLARKVLRWMSNPRLREAYKEGPTHGDG